MGYALVLLDGEVVSRPRILTRSTHFEIEFEQSNGERQRILIIVPRWNRDLDDVTRHSRVLIGGQLCGGQWPRIVAGPSTLVWRYPYGDRARALPRVHPVASHWRVIGSGRRVRVRAHVRGGAGLDRSVKRLVTNDGSKGPPFQVV